MKFELFLNHLSASQTLKSRGKTSALDCNGVCATYNCAIISMEEKSTSDFLTGFFERLLKWKARPERDSFLVYDPANNRLYVTDHDGNEALNLLQTCRTFKSFCSLLESNKKCNDFLSCARMVYI